MDAARKAEIEALLEYQWGDPHFVKAKATIRDLLAELRRVEVLADRGADAIHDLLAERDRRGELLQEALRWWCAHPSLGGFPSSARMRAASGALEETKLLETIEYRTIDKAVWGDGPWQGEPDKKQWQDAETGLACLAVRGPGGHWCGYVGVAPGHPWHGQDYDHPNADVHGGLTFAASCEHARKMSASATSPIPASRTMSGGSGSTALTAVTCRPSSRWIAPPWLVAGPIAILPM